MATKKKSKKSAKKTTKKTKKVSKKKTPKKSSKKVQKKTNSAKHSVSKKQFVPFKKTSFNEKKRMDNVVNRLIMFAILFVASYLLFQVSSPESLYAGIFFTLLLIFGLITLALVIALLVVFFMRILKK